MASSAMRTTVMALERVFDSNHFAALVVAALRADPVRHLGLVALRARRRRLRFEEVVRAARAGAGLRMAAFWIWHRSLLDQTFFFFANCSRLSCSAPQRSSTTEPWHAHVSRFRFAPHSAQSPRQLSSHNGFIGIES